MLMEGQFPFSIEDESTHTFSCLVYLLRAGGRAEKRQVSSIAPDGMLDPSRRRVPPQSAGLQKDGHHCEVIHESDQISSRAR